MIWIGLHGCLFLGLFSDFYKTKYRGDIVGSKASAKMQKMQNGSSGGACMPVLDENDKSTHNDVSSYTIYNKEYNSCYSNGTNNGYVANNNTEKKLA